MNINCKEYCFANNDGKCRALSEAYKENCPFKKTPEKAALDEARADLRLKEKGGVTDKSTE